uniref:Uncharacterized protein n=1 Tax=Arachis duranensis TaxID=130453 RepID=N1NFT1_ARADU|nr:hypothetical protein ARAX_ADH035P21-002 [Arachis duranensis]
MASRWNTDRGGRAATGGINEMRENKMKNTETDEFYLYFDHPVDEPEIVENAGKQNTTKVKSIFRQGQKKNTKYRGGTTRWRQDGTQTEEAGQRLGVSSKQIQAMKATIMKAHIRRDADKRDRRRWRTHKTRRRDGDSAVSVTLALSKCVGDRRGGLGLGRGREELGLEREESAFRKGKGECIGEGGRRRSALEGKD